MWEYYSLQYSHMLHSAPSSCRCSPSICLIANVTWCVLTSEANYGSQEGRRRSVASANHLSVETNSRVLGAGQMRSLRVCQRKYIVLSRFHPVCLLAIMTRRCYISTRSVRMDTPSDSFVCLGRRLQKPGRLVGSCCAEELFSILGFHVICHTILVKTCFLSHYYAIL
jgi:hypothetical protein